MLLVRKKRMLQLWKQADGTTWMGLLGRFTTNSRKSFINVFPNLAPSPPRYAGFSGDVFLDFSNFAAGMGDKVSFGLTQQFRAGAGYDDVVDKTSLAYGVGSSAGQLVNVGFMVVTGRFGRLGHGRKGPASCGRGGQHLRRRHGA